MTKNRHRVRLDLERFKEIGEDSREDLEDFIQHGDMSDQLPGDRDISIPLKNLQLPEFDYDRREQGGVGKGGDGQPQPGDPAGQPEPGDEDDEGEPGDESGEHGHYDMDPEEFADELDDEFDLDFDPKGDKVVEEHEGDWNKIASKGTQANLDRERSYMEAYKTAVALGFDEEYVREALKVEEVDLIDVADHVQLEHNDNVSIRDLERLVEEVDDEEIGKYADFEELDEENEYTPDHLRINDVNIRDDDEVYRQPEIIEEKENNVVVVNIRDISGSMGEEKRDIVERTFTTLDFYLKGKYDHAEYVYIIHDTEAEEVEPEVFFGIRSAGGTTVSTGYERAQEILEERYDWDEWNRYVFGAGDGENSRDDTEKVLDLMDDIPANLHAYVQTQPWGGGYAPSGGYVGEQIEDAEDELDYPTEVAYIDSQDEVVDGVEQILRAAAVSEGSE